MGRKKKKIEKPWCWYCNRDFEDDKILIQHQKAKHFKCHMCHKKLFSGPGLAIHCMQVHKETIDKIPGAVVGRDSTEIEIYGMQGIPEDATRGVAYDDVAGDAKRPRMDMMAAMPPAPGGIPMPPMGGMPGGPPFGGMPPPPFGMPGMPPFPPHPGMPGMPPPFVPPPPFIGRGGPPGGPPPPPWGGPMGPPPPGMPPMPGMPPPFRPPPIAQHISGQSTVPSSYSDRLAQERSDRAPIPDGPLALGGSSGGGGGAPGILPPGLPGGPPPAEYGNGAVKHEGDGDWQNNKTSSQLSAKIRIVHPDDHSISLEERRLTLLASRSSSTAAGYNYRQ